jgi:hypothetical protein
MPDFAIPDNPAKAGDLLYKTREKRLALQKKVDELASQESQLSNYLINTLPKSQASGISGRIANVKIITKRIARVVDWTAFYAYVRKNKREDMLQRRVSDAAIMEVWDNNKTVPGVEPFNVVKVSVTKI